VAKKSPESNGHSRLEEAMAMLIQNQAAFLSRASETDHVYAESERRHLEFERRHFEFERSMDDRVSRIESQMKEVVRILSEHNRTIERLTDAIREKIGFKPQS
jgi:low affinity Fe/Cu permease